MIPELRMSTKRPKPTLLARTNPVAKYAPAANKAVCFRDRTAYTRKNKHKGREPSPVLQIA